MDIKDFEKAKPKVDDINCIETLLSKHKYGWDLNKTEDFEEDSNDFYGSYFFNVKNIDGHHSTGSGSSIVGRMCISEFSDGSGKKYHLSKQEIIKVQEFIKTMLNKSLGDLKEEIKDI